MGSSIFDTAVFTNLRFKGFNKDRLFKRLIKVFDESKYEDYFFSNATTEDKEKNLEFNKKISFFKKEFRKRYMERVQGTLFYEAKKEYGGYNMLFLLLNVKVYYFLVKSSIKGDIKEFILNKIVKSGNFYVPLTEYYLDKEAISNYFLALKWYYDEENKSIYSEELLKDMEEYEKSIDRYDNPVFLKEALDSERRIKWD